jgi:CubicO group peptidase (beta-lactamase class C family)
MLCLAFRPSISHGYDLTPVEQLMQEGVKKHIFPGASIAVIHKGKTVFHQAFGNTKCTPRPTPADTTTIYDLASLTKVIATTAIAMQLVEGDSLEIDRPAARYLPQFGNNGKERITVRQLLTHTSGLRSHADYIDSCRTESELFRAVSQDTTFTEPGTLTVYSDNGFIVLGKIIEAITRRSLADNFRTRFSGPLGLHSTGFTPPPELLSRVALTSRENTWDLNWKRPLVNDQNAAIMGGVAGHAGLFGTTGDLIRFTRMLMEGGELEGVRYFKSSTLKKFTKREGKEERALGWDLRSMDGYASTGPEFSDKSWGHLGFTGTSLWIDPEKDLAVIMLSNRVCPSPENKAIREFRPLLHTTVARCLGYGPTYTQ